MAGAALAVTLVAAYMASMIVKAVGVGEAVEDLVEVRVGDGDEVTVGVWAESGFEDGDGVVVTKWYMLVRP
jgi:hypothetical protein